MVYSGNMSAKERNTHIENESSKRALGNIQDAAIALNKAVKKNSVNLIEPYVCSSAVPKVHCKRTVKKINKKEN